MTYQYDDFPVHVLPPSLRDLILEGQRNIQAPTALIASSILTTISIAAQGLTDVERPNGLTSPISLMFLSIAESGERKTACDEVYSKPIREFETHEEEAAKPQLAAYEVALFAWDQTRKILEENIKSALREENL